MSGRRLARFVALGGALFALATAADAAGDAPKQPAKKTTAPRTAARAPAAAPKRAPTSPVASWHTPTPGKEAPRDASGRPMLALQALNTSEHVAIAARGERGGFAPDDLDRAARVLRDTRTGNEHPIDPRLLDLVYRIQTHFAAQEIRIISGYRTPRAGSNSNHGKGRAIDLVVPGVSNEQVAKFVREQGFVGCGTYPVSGFVHVDVRERSYFWVDTSGPGKKSRIRGILADLAARADADARKRGERPIAPFLLGRDVDAALAAAPPVVAANPAPPADDDEDEGVDAD